MIKMRVGERFNRLTFVEEVSHETAHRLGMFLCECGQSKVIRLTSVLNGTTKSCGCLARETSSRHLSCGTPEYHSWASMIQRCHNKNDKRFSDYGGRGIEVCERWRDSQTGASFFIEDMGKRPKGHTLDRIDNSRGYSPDNCQWSPSEKQQRNKRSNRFVTFRGETKLLIEWAEEFGINYHTLYCRLKRGWSVERALST